jgi:integrase/recombinase XerD
LTVSPTPLVQVQGPGRRERAFPLWPQTADARRAGLAKRGDVSVPAVCLSPHGHAMTRMGFTHRRHQAARLAAPSCPSLQATPITPHVLRHPCAMRIWQATGARRQVALWGHRHEAKEVTAAMIEQHRSLPAVLR